MDATISQFVALGALAGFSGGLINLLLWRSTLKHKKMLGIAIHEGFSEVLQNSMKDIAAEGNAGLQPLEDKIINLFDDFMQNRLTQKMPVLSMFIDEQLIGEIRTIFHAEMSASLPQLLQAGLSENSTGTGITSITKNAIQKIFLRYRLHAIIYLIIGTLAGGLLGLLADCLLN